MARPTSVTVVAILLIVFGALGLLGAVNNVRLMNDPKYLEILQKMEEAGAGSSLPKSMQIAVMFIGPAVLLVAGLASHQGQGWGRWLYIGWTLVILAVGLATTAMPLGLVMAAPGLLICALLSFFLFRPKANAYFRGEGALDEATA